MPAALYWAQEPAELLGYPDEWEVAYSIDGDAWVAVELESPAEPCSRCWEALAYPPRELGWLRARAHWDSGEVSPWTPRTPLPEPHLVDVLGLAVLALVLIRWGRRS